MRKRRWTGRCLLAAAWLLLGGCATGGAPAEGEDGAAPPGARTAPGSDAGEMVPAGYGTLRQEDVTVSLGSGDLLIKVTPLEEWVIRLTAPDTYDRLAGLRRTHSEALERRAMAADVSPFLVTLFSYQPNVTYQPEDVNLVSQGLQQRPLAIEPITPGWGSQRLGQQESRMAIYGFPPDIDLESELTVEYGQSRSDAWERILPLLRAERAKVRARAPGGL